MVGWSGYQTVLSQVIMWDYLMGTNVKYVAHVEKHYHDENRRVDGRARPRGKGGGLRCT